MCCSTSHYAVEVFAVGVGNEYLTKYIARYELHDALDTLRVELVKQVVKQQYRCRVAIVGQEVVLCQLQGYQVGLALSLRAYTFHGIFVQCHLHVVAMNTLGGIAEYKVAMAGIGKLL